MLTHYDQDLPLTLACDALNYGIGAIISHVFPDSKERHIAFESKTSNSAQRGYSQIEKKALSIVFGVRKFYQYLYERHFTLITDHCPLLTIFGPKNAIPSVAAARLQRCAQFLSGFQYEIKNKNTKVHGNADGLARLPPSKSTAKSSSKSLDCVDLYLLSHLNDSLPVTSQMISRETSKDQVLSKVCMATSIQW